MGDERRKEGIEINSSLSALTRCINALVKGKYPGYRDSPLTYLLKDSLGGNSKTTLLVCASPHIYNRSETVRTLRFAATAKDVKNKAHINQTLSVKALLKKIKMLEAENKLLKKKLKKKGGYKRKGDGGFMRELGKRMSLFPAKRQSNSLVSGVAVDGNLSNTSDEYMDAHASYDQDGKPIERIQKEKVVKKKKKLKKSRKKKKKKKPSNGMNGHADDDDDESEDDDDIERERKSWWACIFYCGGDNEEEIEEEVDEENDIEYAALND